MAEDFFTALGVERRPWLEPEQVKERFHALSREQHPDQQAGGSTGETDAVFARLNAAQAALRDPKARLRGLLEIEFPHVKVSGPAAVPGTLADLFAPTLELLQQIDALLAKKAGASSGLARALLAREELVLQEAAQARLGELETLHASALAELREFDARWERPRPPDAAERLHDFYQRFAYLSRWTEQLRERLFQLGT